MPVLKYWDQTAGAYVQLLAPGGQATAYAQVQATAPNSSAPAIAPPNGFLWVDTSSSSTISNLPYFPQQTPPASGFNSFTDGSGEVWVSLNGSAWKKARDVLHCQLQRSAIFTVPQGWIGITYDTILSDPYGLYNAGTTYFKAPIPGIYSITAQLTVNMTASGQWAHHSVFKNGTELAEFSMTAFGATWGQISLASSLKLVPSDNIQAACQASIALSSVAGTIYTFANFDYLGTG